MWWSAVTGSLFWVITTIIHKKLLLYSIIWMIHTAEDEKTYDSLFLFNHAVKLLYE